MSNVISDLFSSIADAIRSKTGRQNKMSPSDFPTEIASILTSGQWKIAQGSMTTSSNNMLTITHNLEAIPDIVYVHVSGTTSLEMSYVGGFGFSEAMGTAIQAQDVMGIYGAQSVNTSFGALTITPPQGIDKLNTADLFGPIRNATTTTFEVGGGSQTPILTNRTLTWWAVSGII